MSISALISIFPCDSLVSKGHACVSVDFQAPLPAPNGECARIEVHLFDSVPLSSELLESLVGLFEPLGVGVRS